MMSIRRKFQLLGRLRKHLFSGAAVLGIIVISVASCVRQRNASIVLNAQAECVGFTLSSRWTWHGRLSAGSAYLSRVAAVDTALFPALVAPAGDGWIRVDSAALSLDFLDLGEGASVEACVPEVGQVDLDITKAALTGRLQVAGTSRISAGALVSGPATTATATELRFPELLEFRSDRGAGVHLSSRGSAILRDLEVSELRFSREVPVAPGRRESRSLLVGARLSFPEVGREVSLLDGHRLILEGVKGRVLTLTLGDRFGTVFEGTVKHVRAGGSTATQDLTPTLLEWCYHTYRNQLPAVLVAAFLGLLWKFRFDAQSSRPH